MIDKSNRESNSLEEVKDTMYMIALVLTIIGWAFQFHQKIIKKDRYINPILPLAYVIACILFGINSFTAGDMVYGILDAVCALLVTIVFIMLVIREKAIW